MINKLGIVCNIWEKRIVEGGRFESLTKMFVDNGFKHIEIRDGEYLRSTEIGHFFEAIETAMDRYSNVQWKSICNNRDQLRASDHLFNFQDKDLFHRIASFAGETADAKFSYAIAHPWGLKPDSIEDESSSIL